MDSPGPFRKAPSMEVPPFRSSDFMGKFMLPAYKDPPRFIGRIRDNLLYYQTNYFLIWLAFVLLCGFLRPQRMMSSVVSLTMAMFIYLLLTLRHPEVSTLRRQYPYALAGILLCCTIGVWYYFDIYLIAWGCCLPILLILSHASFRARNINNKLSKAVAQTKESFGSTKTPMGHILSTFMEIK